MAQTMQLISKTQYVASSAIPEHAKEPEDIISLMLSACDSLNNLYIILEKVYRAMKNAELQNRLKEKEKTSPHSGAV